MTEIFLGSIIRLLDVTIISPRETINRFLFCNESIIAERCAFEYRSGSETLDAATKILLGRASAINRFLDAISFLSHAEKQQLRFYFLFYNDSNFSRCGSA